MGNKILITGATGFIGSYLTNRLSINNEVTVLDNNFRGNLNNISSKTQKKIKIIKGDIRNYKLVENSLKNNDIVIHLAFINGTSHFYKNPGLVLDVGITGTLNIIKAINSKKNRVKKFLFASSSEIYQTPKKIPTNEKAEGLVPDINNPRYSYGSSKLIGEILTIHMLNKKVKKIIFRPHNIYGPRMGNLHVIPQLILKIKKKMLNKNIKLKIQGSGNETRSFCYINDAIDAINILINKGKNKEIYNIGSQKEISINKLIKLIAFKLKKKIKIIKKSLAKGSTKRRCPDIKKIKKLGFYPKISLSEGLDKTIDYYINKIK